MHIGYFYDDGRESARERLAVFRDISFKEDGYFAFFGSSDFNVGEKNGPVFLKIDFETLMKKSGIIFNNFFSSTNIIRTLLKKKDILH